MSLQVIRFLRDPQEDLSAGPDLLERFGNYCIGALPISMGRTVKVLHSSEGEKFEHYLPKDLDALTLQSLGCLSFTPLLIGIGSLGLYFSSTHKTLLEKYLQPKKDCSLPCDLAYRETPQKEPFTKKFDRASASLFRVGLRPVLAIILHEFRQDDALWKMIQAWTCFKQQNTHLVNPSMEDLLCQELEKGTCYGQAMNILELVGSANRDTISEEYLSKNIHLPTHIRYQILHILDVFFTNNPSKYVHGMSRKVALKTIAESWPHHKKEGKSTERLSLAKVNTEILTGRLSDFVRLDIRSQDASDEQKDFAIKISLTGKHEGHAAIMYYSETKKLYMWYDPYTDEHGLFSSTDKKTFFEGVSEKIMEYAKRYTYVSFNAYDLQKALFAQPT